MDFLFTLSITAILFWAGIFVLLLILISNDFFAAGLIIILGLIIGTFYHHSINPFTWFVENITLILTCVALYLTVGFFWSFIAINLYFKELFKTRLNVFPENSPPQVRYYYGIITNYIIFWPFSVTSFILKDVVKNTVEIVVNYFASIYQAIINRQFEINKKKE